MMPEPVAWSTAARVARRVAANEPFSTSYLRAPLTAQFDELTAEAEARVATETGLVSTLGPARARVVDRDEWAVANLASMRRLLAPALERASRRASPVVAFAGRYVTAAELGAVLGWMSSRVLGQYDPVIDDATGSRDQDFVYYVAPNVLALEKRFAFPPEEFRLWLALHECAHRAQFTGVTWLTSYFKAQVEALTNTEGFDLEQAARGIRRALQKPEPGEHDLGMMAAFAGPEQQARLSALMGLMSLLEGHGEVVMDRAGEGRIPNAQRFHRVLHERRAQAKGVTKVIQRLLGMDVKLRQYAQGAAFIRAVEAHGGRALFDRVWTSSETLPSYPEIFAPDRWIARMANP